MSLRSLTTCSYVSDATSFAMRHCTIVVTPLPMFPEPDSFRPREIHHRPNASCLGNEKKSPCRWWLIDGCKSLFNVKPSTVPTRLIPELDAHTRTTHPERFLRAEKSRRPNTQHQMGRPSTSYRGPIKLDAACMRGGPDHVIRAATVVTCVQGCYCERDLSYSKIRHPCIVYSV